MSVRGRGAASRRGGTFALAGLLAAVLGGCGSAPSGTADLVNGKELFVQRCGACHVLERAGTTGVSGPDLDQAFVAARRDGLGASTVEGVVHGQIFNPNPEPQTDPKTGESLAVMPADLVTGDDARDVAAYVAMAVGVGGEDSGRLAQVGAAQAEGTAEAEGGELEIAADPDGALAYVFADAIAPPGALDMLSPNESSVPHNIALEGGGIDEVGEVVQNGGVSEISVDVEPGEYVFYCSVLGHREAGMEGTLTVE